MTIQEELDYAKRDPLYSEHFSEEGEKSLKTITTGLQVTFIHRKPTNVISVDRMMKANGPEDNSNDQSKKP